MGHSEWNFWPKLQLLSAELNVDRCVHRVCILIPLQVRNSAPSSTVNLTLTFRSPRPSGIPVPALQTVSTTMKPQLALGLYTLFAGSYALPASQVLSTKFDVSVGALSDSFKNVHEVQSISTPFLSPNATNTTAPTPKQSGPALLGFTYLGCKTDSTAARVL